ncbi:hypothetical protein PC119_g27606, partial [Phytophthora cactorum]
KDVGGDANVNANLGSNGVLANFQLAAGQLEVHASGGRSWTRSSCISSSNMTDTRMSTLINSFTEIAKERQATPLMPEPTPGVPIRVFCRLIYSVTTIRAH